MVITCLLVVGTGLSLLGAALFLNIVSLRALAQSSQLYPAIWLVFVVRDELTHRRAQWLELLVGAGGLTIVLSAAWWNHARQRSGAHP